MKPEANAVRVQKKEDLICARHLKTLISDRPKSRPELLKVCYLNKVAIEVGKTRPSQLKHEKMK